jgi:cytochrome b561
MTAPKGYSARQIRLHWIVTVLIVLQFVLHDAMSEAWDLIEDGQTPAFHWLVLSHVIGGVLVFIFALWRLALRATRGVPPAPLTEPPVLARAAHFGHLALYALMIAMPLSGMAAWFGGLEPAAEVHEVLRIVLLALIAGHVLAALWHHFWLKDGLLLRMKRPLD